MLGSSFLGSAVVPSSGFFLNFFLCSKVQKSVLGIRPGLASVAVGGSSALLRVGIQWELKLCVWRVMPRSDWGGGGC